MVVIPMKEYKELKRFSLLEIIEDVARNPQVKTLEQMNAHFKSRESVIETPGGSRIAITFSAEVLPPAEADSSLTPEPIMKWRGMDPRVEKILKFFRGQ
jgi:hypothetical protein